MVRFISDLIFFLFQRTQKLIVSQFWRLKVQNHGVSRAVLPQKAPGENPSSSLLASGVCRQSLMFLGF